MFNFIYYTNGPALAKLVNDLTMLAKNNESSVELLLLFAQCMC